MEQTGRARRSDAIQNEAAILAAAERVFRTDPRAGMVEVARAAGVSRRTLYMHFPSRTELVAAVFERAVATANAHLDPVDLDGPPAEALERLVRSSWHEVDGVRTLLGVAEDELPAELVRAHHDLPLRRVANLLARGRATGDFRADLSVEWLTAMFFAAVHTAAAEVRAGRLEEHEAPEVLVRTLTSICAG